MRIDLTVNQVARSADVEPRTSLLDMIREDLSLTGTHVGCEHGVCGCCNVLLDGLVVRSCLVLAAQAHGADIVTVEGLESGGGELSPLQEAFCRHHAMQCGYCTPGILVAVSALLAENPTPDPDQIAETLAGNLCRCTGYQQIFDAVTDVVEANAEGQARA